jgi:hypothetical protein
VYDEGREQILKEVIFKDGRLRLLSIDEISSQECVSAYGLTAASQVILRLFAESSRLLSADQDRGLKV